MDEVLIEDDVDDSGKSQSPLRHADMGFSSPQMDFPVKSTFEASGSLDGNVETFIMDTTINLDDYSQLSIPEQTLVIPPEVLQAKSNMEEVRTSGITADISDMDANVTKGDGVSSSQAQGTSDSIIVSFTFETTYIDTSTTLPLFHSSISTSLPQSTISPTFQNIINQPITSLFPSQTTEGPTSIPDNTIEDDDVCISFADLQFDPEDEDIPDHMLMSGKQFNILN